MVKKGKKDFTSGLDMLIQKTTVSDDPEATEGEVREESKGGKETEKQLTITMPSSLRREIKMYCADNDISVKDLIIRSVKRYMKVDGADAVLKK